MDVTELSDGDLATLAHALHEARFARLYNDPAIWAAPFVVQLHVDVLSEQWHRAGVDDPVSDMRIGKWLQWKSRSEHETVLSRVRGRSGWAQAMRKDPNTMREVLRPFVVDDESMEEFRAAAENGETPSD